jgi:hypothetical protein
MTMTGLVQAKAPATDTPNLTQQQIVEQKKKLLKEKEDAALQALVLKVVSALKPNIETMIGKAVQSEVKAAVKANVDKPREKGESAIMIVSIIVISVVSLAISAFLILSAIYGPKDRQFPLGLPDGSIRAIIAVIIIVFYILVSITLSMYSSTASAIANDLTKTLGTLVVAVSAFYFGSKTAEQGAKTATDNFSKAVNNANNKTNTDTVVPLAVINAAIDANKANWLKLYGAQDITAGKKQAGAVTNDLDCIVFIVTTKGAISTDVNIIPPFIVFNYQGKTYNIPTDVNTRQ